MEAIKEPDWNTVGILGAARGAAQGTGEEAVGTDHLLAGITTAKGPAREALEAAGATRTAVAAVLREAGDRGITWSGDDDVEASVHSKDVLGEDGTRNTRFTGAAARALTAAMEQAQGEDAKKFGAVHLLRALLAEDNRAVGVLAACGISPQPVLARLDGGGTGPQDDDLDPLLHPTRDALLGRTHYRHKTFWKRWLLKRVGVNWASRPAWWVSMETHEQARRLAHDTVGTEHVLLAVLATHEVALQYPHMTEESTPTPDTRYTGSERLTRMGLDYATVHNALTTARIPLTADARPAEQYLAETTSPVPSPVPSPAPPPAAASDNESTTDPGTGPLVELLLKEDTRARQLIDALSTTSDR